MYKDRYNELYFGERTINATRVLMTKIWGNMNSKRDRIAGINEWLDALCEEHSIPRDKVEFYFIEGNEGLALYKETGGGQVFYDTGSQSIKIFMYRKFSLTTLLHEFRHAIQYLRPNYVSQDGLMLDRDNPLGERLQFDAEEDAREWSCSLYFVADEDRYMRAVQNNKLRFA